MPLDGGVKCQRASVRGRKMRKKGIPIILLLLISMATPVVVSMAIPKNPDAFYIVAELDELTFALELEHGVQKYTQSGYLYEEYGDPEPIGTIDLDIVITNFDKAFTGKYARATVHFIMRFDDSDRTISGTIVGKIWFEGTVQHIEGIFVGRGSHVKGTVSLPEQDVLLFEGTEW